MDLNGKNHGFTRKKSLDSNQEFLARDKYFDAKITSTSQRELCAAGNFLGSPFFLLG